MIETNKIKEIYKGHYQVILDFPEPKDLFKIVDVSYKYIWSIGHYESSVIWSKYNFLLYGQKTDSIKVKARNIEMEYLIDSSEFLKLSPYINQTLHIIQTNEIPPSYMNIKNLSGKGRYDLLKSKIDYLFELEMPGATDYAPLISPNIEFLNDVIKKMNNEIGNVSD